MAREAYAVTVLVLVFVAECEGAAERVDECDTGILVADMVAGDERVDTDERVGTDERVAVLVAGAEREGAVERVDVNEIGVLVDDLVAGDERVDTEERVADFVEGPSAWKCTSELTCSKLASWSQTPLGPMSGWTRTCEWKCA